MKAFIFDLDGVLVFTDKYHYLAWKQVADQENIFFNEEINHRLRGVSRMESLDIILENTNKHYSNQEKIEMAERKNEIYKQYLQGMSKNDVDEDVLFTLKSLKQQGAKLAIGSSSKNAVFILKQTNLIEYFDAISDGNNITKSKPDPEVFLKAALMLGVKPSESYVIEDAQAGIDAANSGGFIAISIGAAYDYEKAKIRIKNIKELLDINNLR